MTEPQPLTTRGRPHGRVSSWVLVGVLITAFAVGGTAMILHLWAVFWACLAVVVLSVPTGMLIGIMDDTVGWTLPLSPTHRHRYRSVSAAAEGHRRESSEHDRARAEVEESS